MIETCRAGVLVIVPLLVQACSGEVSDPAQYVGTWTAKEARQSEAAGITLILRDNSSFEAAAFPAKLVCPAVQNKTGVSGSGTWTMARGQRRIDLNFQELSNVACAVPYLANVFHERSFGSVVIVAYPDGVDGASTAIRLTRQE